MTIEALDQQTVTLELGSEIVSSLSRLMSFVQGPENTLPYEIYGKVTLDRRGREPLQFSAERPSAARDDGRSADGATPCRCGCSCSPSAC